MAGRQKQQWQRARSPEQKEERTRAILEAAGRLLDEEGLDGTGLNAIAREAGLSKPNLYVYFESREAILLRLLLDESEAWCATLCRRLARLEEAEDVEAVARAFAESLHGRRRFCLLMRDLSAVLETNVGPEAILGFKRSFHALVAPSVEALVRALPVLDADRAFFGLAMLLTSATALWPHCHPGPAAAEVLARPEFAAMRWQFKPAVRDHARLLLAGMVAEAAADG